jgi:2-(1,2-epoxy-1,2-dihydrophenyl)acetyl-CoA isomerase
MTICEMHEGVATLTLDNPGSLNSLDNTTRPAFLAALRRVMDDDGCVAVILTGANGNFCAGGDIASMPTVPSGIRARLGEMHDIVRLIHSGPKPVVTAVDGVAFGSGFALACASDWIIASHDARFGCTFGKIALIADTGLFWTLPHRVGPSQARQILLENKRIPLEDGLRIGLINEVCSSADLLARAGVWASAFRGTAPGAVAATKKMLSSSAGSLDELLAAELETQITLLASENFAEGRKAFFEKRSPHFGPTN